VKLIGHSKRQFLPYLDDVLNEHRKKLYNVLFVIPQLLETGEPCPGTTEKMDWNGSNPPFYPRKTPFVGGGGKIFFT